MFNNTKFLFYNSVFNYLKMLNGVGVTNPFEMENLIQERFNVSKITSHKLVLDYMGSFF